MAERSAETICWKWSNYETPICSLNSIRLKHISRPHFANHQVGKGVGTAGKGPLTGSQPAVRNGAPPRTSFGWAPLSNGGLAVPSFSNPVRMNRYNLLELHSKWPNRDGRYRLLSGRRIERPVSACVHQPAIGTD
jgi:hypothetical protein